MTPRTNSKGLLTMTKDTDDAIPPFCDFSCPHSDFPPADSAGLCRTMAAVYCGKLDKLVNKNGPCEWKRAGKPAAKKR